MARVPVKSLLGKQLSIKIEQTEGSGTFVMDCLINTDRGIEFSTENTQEVAPWCGVPSNDDGVPWTEIDIDSLTATITGSGKLHTPSVKTWFAWLRSGEAKAIRAELTGVSAADGGGWWEGDFKLTAFQVNGSDRGKADASITLVSNGEIEWMDAT